MLENSEEKKRERKEEMKDGRVNKKKKADEQTKTTVGLYWGIIILELGY